MYRTIVMGYDGSTAARKAFDAALELAARDHAELHVVSVGRPSEIADDVETEAVIEHTRAYHRRLLAELENKLASGPCRRLRISWTLLEEETR